MDPCVGGHRKRCKIQAGWIHLRKWRRVLFSRCFPGSGLLPGWHKEASPGSQYIWRGLAQISELARNIKYVLSAGPDGLTVEGFELTDGPCALTGKDETLLSPQTLNGDLPAVEQYFSSRSPHTSSTRSSRRKLNSSLWALGGGVCLFICRRHYSDLRLFTGFISAALTA